MSMKIYCSHSIRGVKGEAATEEDIKFNCDRIKLIVGRLRKQFPEIEFYLPAEHEDFVNQACQWKLLNEQQILSID